MIVTATEAKNRFGYVLAQSKRGPVSVEKNGRIEALLISTEHYAQLQQAAPVVSVKQKQQAFNATYKEWIDAQNKLVQEHGVFGDEYRVW
ncbi:MAG: type II toxin-antitoxin system prevent-host-death family antitoxin [Cytophagales bacterium]|nr:type II toxin-antitoxin system prevent-host-death family antitoxin [Cytophagales bacterium]